jgi:hypothetical protein
VCSAVQRVSVRSLGSGRDVLIVQIIEQSDW